MTTTLPPLVGLIGKKRVGKDTFASVLVEEFGFARVAFADPLKEMALTIDPLLGRGGLGAYVEQFGWEEVKDTFPEARRFLQRLGDSVRQFDQEFWVRAGMTQARAHRVGNIVDEGPGWYAADPRPVVITDVRYPNEAAAIREAGGTLVRIVRPGVDDGDTHASETALDRYECEEIFANDSSVADLRDWVRAFAGIELGL